MSRTQSRTRVDDIASRSVSAQTRAEPGSSAVRARPAVRDRVAARRCRPVARGVMIVVLGVLFAGCASIAPSQVPTQPAPTASASPPVGGQVVEDSLAPDGPVAPDLQPPAPTPDTPVAPPAAPPPDEAAHPREETCASQGFSGNSACLNEVPATFTTNEFFVALASCNGAAYSHHAVGWGGTSTTGASNYRFPWSASVEDALVTYVACF